MKYARQIQTAINRLDQTLLGLNRLIKEGKNEFTVETSIDKKGKYGRLLGKLFRLHEEFKPGNEMRSYNQILLDEGHAIFYDGGKR